MLKQKTGFSPQQTTATTQRKTVIAVDGPAASGKGTLAKALAERFGYAYLDTGALYRAVALATLELNGDPENINDVRLSLDIVKRNLTPELLVNPALRKHEISSASSKVAALPEVRIELMEWQRAFAKNPPGNVGGAVIDGRDIGTVICPGANIKFFVTAAPEVRAERRLKDLKADRSDLTLEQVLEDIRQRDQRDSTRKIAPTRAADDAYMLDTTRLNAAQAVEEAVALIKSKMLKETQE
jgi:cytidylate kinase